MTQSDYSRALGRLLNANAGEFDLVAHELPTLVVGAQAREVFGQVADQQHAIDFARRVGGELQAMGVAHEGADLPCRGGCVAARRDRIILRDLLLVLGHCKVTVSDSPASTLRGAKS